MKKLLTQGAILCVDGFPVEKTLFFEVLLEGMAA